MVNHRKVRHGGFVPPCGGRIFNSPFGGCNLKSAAIFQERRPVQAESVGALDTDIDKLSDQFVAATCPP